MVVVLRRSIRASAGRYSCSSVAFHNNAALEKRKLPLKMHAQASCQSRYNQPTLCRLIGLRQGPGSASSACEKAQRSMPAPPCRQKHINQKNVARRHLGRAGVRQPFPQQYRRLLLSTEIPRFTNGGFQQVVQPVVSPLTGKRKSPLVMNQPRGVFVTAIHERLNVDSWIPCGHLDRVALPGALVLVHHRNHQRLVRYQSRERRHADIILIVVLNCLLPAIAGQFPLQNLVESVVNGVHFGRCYERIVVCLLTVNCGKSKVYQKLEMELSPR